MLREVRSGEGGGEERRRQDVEQTMLCSLTEKVGFEQRLEGGKRWATHPLAKSFLDAGTAAAKARGKSVPGIEASTTAVEIPLGPVGHVDVDREMILEQRSIALASRDICSQVNTNNYSW